MESTKQLQAKDVLAEKRDEVSINKTQKEQESLNQETPSEAVFNQRPHSSEQNIEGQPDQLKMKDTNRQIKDQGINYNKKLNK